jgi:glutaredoxin-like YruB-family protein
MSDKEVKVYSSPSCSWCVKVKDFLKENGVAYTDFNVAEDATAREDIVKRSGQMGVPVIDIDGDLVIGFNQPVLKEKLGI